MPTDYKRLIFRYLTDNNMTQRDFAKKAKLHYQTINNILNLKSKKTITIETWDKIEKVLKGK